MKVFKRIAVLVLAMSLFVGMFGVSGVQAKERTANNGAAIDYVTEDGLQIRYWDHGAVTKSPTSWASVVGYEGKNSKVVIPDFIGEHRVYEITANAFTGNTTITSVELPGSLERILHDAFNSCTNLKSVIFGDHYKYLEDMGETVGKMTFPTELDYGVFYGCTSLEEIEFPYGIDAHSGYNTFFGNSGLKKATIRFSHYTNIGKLFNGADKLEVLNIDLREDGRGDSYGLANVGDLASLKEINIYHAEHLEQNIMVYYSDKLKSSTNFYLKDCPKLKNVNLYYNETNSDGKPVAYYYRNSASANVPFLRNCPSELPAYDDKSFIAVSSDESVVKIKSDGRNNDMELIGPGEATITYKDMPFTINVHVGAGQQKKNIADAKLTMPLNKATYTGKEIEPYFYIVDDKTVLEQDKDYTVAVKDNVEIGTGTITLTGKGDYTGTLTASFTINPGPVIAKSVVIGKKKSVITLNADKQADGYQIYYSSKKAKGYKKLYSGTDLKAEVSGLKSGQYIRVRTYKKVGKTTYYSEWSAPVKVQ